MKIYLEFPPEAGPIHRARLSYAFRLFCAIYGHQPLFERQQSSGADISISYSSQSHNTRRRCVYLANLYKLRSPKEPAPPPQWWYSQQGERFILHYHPDSGLSPDWLAEIFEWISCADEYSIAQRDYVGRIPYEATYIGRHHLDIETPYAAVAMRYLQQEIIKLIPEANIRPVSPVKEEQHFVIPTHDVDYFPVGRAHAVRRLIQNAAISCLLEGSPSLGMHQAWLALYTALGGTDPLDKMSVLAEEERQREIKSSYYFLVRHLHKQDARYTLQSPQVLQVIHNLKSMEMEVGLHSSYTCLEYPMGLESECSLLRANGIRPEGMRQHWLRFTLDSLVPAVEMAHLHYDASIGWSETMGFRAGACFAFPPYNFEQERPATFLEIPLVMMDQALRSYQNPLKGRQKASKILAISRQMGWGGIAVLWHPASFGSGWLAPHIGNAYWYLVDNRDKWGDTWTSASDFIRLARNRYIDVGLLPKESDTAESHVTPLLKNFMTQDEPGPILLRH